MEILDANSSQARLWGLGGLNGRKLVHQLIVSGGVQSVELIGAGMGDMVKVVRL